jgi:hypothetical protein
MMPDIRRSHVTEWGRKREWRYFLLLLRVSFLSEPGQTLNPSHRMMAATLYSLINKMSKKYFLKIGVRPVQVEGL